MEILRLYIIFLLLFISLQISFGFEDDEDTAVNEVRRYAPPRVDVDVKRPYRACQGFEDPEEVDCYMRSEMKKYVCTEPTSFNPCESEIRVTTYHYDHIKHRCDKVNVPVCTGQIIRAMSLIQCLIYCHNNDPFALGKSTSMVFKLNQKKPYIPKDEELEESEQSTNFVDDDDDLKINVKDSASLNNDETVSKENLKDKIKKSVNLSKNENVVKNENKMNLNAKNDETSSDFKEKNVNEKEGTLSVTKSLHDTIKKKEKKETDEIHKKELKDSKKEKKSTEQGNVRKKESSVDFQKKFVITENKKELKPDEKKEPEDVASIKSMITNDRKEEIKKGINPLGKKSSEQVKVIIENNKYGNNIKDFKSDDTGIDKKEKLDDKIEKKKKLFIISKPILKEERPELNPENKREIEFMDEENNIVRRNDVLNVNDKILKVDNKDKESDDGFYLWDE